MWLIGFLLAAFGIYLVFRFVSQAPRTIRISDFTPRANLPDDCDTILLRLSQGTSSGPGSAEIFLETAGRETWWKEIQLFISNRPRGSIRAEGHGSRAPGRLVVFPHELAEAQLVFVKPKFLGAATAVSVSKVWRTNRLRSSGSGTAVK